MDVGATGTISRPAPPGGRRRGAGHSHSNSRAASPAVMVPGDGSPLPGPNAQLAPAEMLVSDDSEMARSGRIPSPPATARAAAASSQPGEIPLEAVERALEGLSREDLVMALKRAKEHMDQLDSRLESQTLTIESLHAETNELTQKLSLAEAEADSLQQAVQQREERVDELLSEQYKMEDEVYSKLGVMERLRKQLDESERARAEAERRYEEQTRTTDTERQYYADAEALLQSQKANTTSSNERLIAQNHQLMQENARLQAKVARLRPQGDVPAPAAEPDEPQQDQPSIDSEHNGQATEADQDEDATDGAASSSASRSKIREVAPLRPLRSLKDETASQELEQLRNELVTLQRSHASLNTSHQSLQQELRAVKAQNVELRDQNESYLDILQEKTLSGALITESAVLNRRYSAVADESEPPSEVTSEMDEDKDDVSDVPDEPKASRRRANRQRASTLERAVSEQPTSLANELEGADEDNKDKEAADASQQWRNHRQRERLENLSNDPAVLKKEVAELQDANQALTLYISKIIDRIIAREGYENVLASDADGKRTLRGQSSRLRGQRSRVQLLPRDGERRPTESAAPSTPSAEEAKQAKRASVGILGFGRANASSTDSPTLAKPRRTASIDWRSWVPAAVGGTPSSPAVDPREAQLRPLALSPASTSTATFGPSPRRREIEDAADEAERERIRAHLSMQGIDTENLPSGPRPPLARGTGSTGASSSIGTFLSRVIPGAAVAGSSGSPSTPKKDNIPLPPTSEPRLTTFDDIRKASSGSSGGHLGPGSTSASASRKASNGMLSIDESGNSSVLTEGSSVAGDESYAYEDIALGGNGSTGSGSGSVGSVGRGGEGSSEADEPGWRKALKRMSLLGGEVAPPQGS